MNCPYVKQCGFCKIKQSYAAQAKAKLLHVQDLLAPFGKVDEILTMDDPLFYRNKLTATFSRGKDKKLVAGHYEEGTRNVVPAELCYLENEKAQAIVKDIVRLANSFKFTYYDPRTGQGLLRHIQVRIAESTGQIMVTLVTGTPIFPSRNNFCKVLRKEHPEITTLVQNINPEPGSMVLGKRFQTLYGPGYIEDQLLGLTFRLSPAAFYQVNSRMTEKLYQTAIDFARITRTDDVIDAYCGTGTIGLSCADFAKSVIGCELSPDAVRDACANAKRNNIENITFLCEDAGDFLQDMALEGASADVVLMDPPRSGSSDSFLAACIRMAPSRIVYVSCDPETLARDLEHLTLGGYRMTKAKCVDMFPHTEHVETVVLMSRVKE